ncbi:virus tail fiber assembly protein lambda gpK [Frischella perrara]|uniref:Caudovirales tail fiber assembly protein n=1 Tax=Frischella perrara TaxID=1267021 RepID=A0A0A7S6W1_FRIPE|nr:tail fiber assembly protein [Frischella perrara]AJA44971.1 Caudovirales tail fiber assembly protein [Frischella perrara]PWV58638.1 virus tail fiber assembly protein lambda gpK [Frischella perrara]
MISNKEYADLAVKANAENKVIYKHENGEYELVDQLTYQTCSYVDGEWVEDVTKKASYQQKIINMNKLAISSLLEEANNNISMLQDAIDLDMQEGNEEERIKEWKRYRILLTRIDVNNIVNIEYPEKPIF